jgi:hypothetical protein
LSNKDLLREIHLSKVSYCSFIKEEYERFDAIAESYSTIDAPLTIEAAKKKRAASLSTKEHKIDPDSIPLTDLVIRVMEKDHIPDTGKNGTKASVNFPPFKHYALIDDIWVEVGRSHWIGSFSNGEFCCTHGRLTAKLGEMFILLTDSYARRRNFRSYSYVDEMKASALLQLSSVALRFDESKGSNPFSFMTTVMKHIYVRNITTEKKNQTIRDDLLIQHGAAPSISRQLKHELDSQFAAYYASQGVEEVLPIPPVRGKAGRKPKGSTGW